ncbi:hypothetical protein A3Q34_00780 [Colwellia sp. PAMC 20917]|jgi:hypothetical protein|uniref:hypothetical protein n=1 Tax=Colwellia sp. PAMC 20917 TaxID=1816218 RepID=UPI0008784B63|nr:hypothetical protein [Colwellia sp. PAMC 20917]AOW75542.1 hypothetical protein A3Q34_00780 [Colwellia sp. PAMC 20917]
MKKDEIVVSDALVTHYLNKGYKTVTYSEPSQDPPDIILQIDQNSYPIEITKIDENSLNRRTNFAHSYGTFIKQIIAQKQSEVPKNVSYYISVRHSGTKVGKIRKKFILFFDKKILAQGFSNDEYIFLEGSVKITFKKLNTSKGGQHFPMSFSTVPVRQSNDIKDFLNSMIEPLDVGFQSIVRNSICVKSKKCSAVKPTIWLALYDFYANKFNSDDNEQILMYQNAIANITEKDNFDRILVVLESGAVVNLFDKHT